MFSLAKTFAQSKDAYSLTVAGQVGVLRLRRKFANSELSAPLRMTPLDETSDSDTCLIMLRIT